MKHSGWKTMAKFTAWKWSLGKLSHPGRTQDEINSEVSLCAGRGWKVMGIDQRIAVNADTADLSSG